jgi:hypothetical protein
VSDAVTQERIRQKTDAVEIEKDGRVPDVFDPRHTGTLARLPVPMCL